MTRTDRIQSILTQELSPIFLSVDDESHMHHVPDGAQTHFKVIAVSSLFSDLSRIKRHKLVNQLLKDEFNTGLHALSMHLYTKTEWDSKGSILQSPMCKDGYKNG